MAKGKGTDIEMMPIEAGRKTIWHLQKMKEEGKLISMVGTAYLDPLFTMICEKAGIDLVRYTAPGESAEMRGENMLWWTRMQRKAAPNICLNAVMQTHQYADKFSAAKNGALLVENGADCVMPMGVTNETLQYMSDNLIPVFGHVGCLSGWQTGAFGGYRRQGKTAEDAMRVFRQAYEYQECGMIGMTTEMTSRELTNLIAKKLRIPVVQVAAGGVADGSEMVIFDLLGFVPSAAMAKHGKYYAKTFDSSFAACTQFDKEVKEQIYPAEEHGWGMDEAELDKFRNELDSKYPDIK